MRNIEEYTPIDGEEWKIVDGRLLYSVSNFGRVRYEWFPGEYRMVNQHRYGAHLVVILSKANQKKTVPVATLVANAFLGERPKGSKVIHKDLDTANNSADNLEYASGAKYGDYISRCHRELHGRTGNDNKEMAREAREEKEAMYAEVIGRWTRKEIVISQAAEELGISQSAVSRWKSRHNG